MSRVEKAKEYFLKGYACSQAVLMAFGDVTGLDEETAAKIVLPFGGGFGRLRLVCGAVSGVTAVLGMVYADADGNPQNKKAVYERVQTVLKEFERENGSLICGELLAGASVKTTTEPKPDERNMTYMKKRPCAELVGSAASILEKYLISDGVIVS